MERNERNMVRNIYNNPIKCPLCNQNCELDDVDYNFEGNQDNYWVCNTCDLGFIERVRYGKRLKITSYYCEKQGGDVPCIFQYRKGE